jgi:hypothetical protein
MNGAKQAASLSATLEQLDVQTWAAKSVRECYSIAARSAPPGKRATIDPARVGAVLGALVELLESERQTLTGAPPSRSG